MPKLARQVCGWRNSYQISDFKDFLEHLRVVYPKQYYRFTRTLGINRENREILWNSDFSFLENGFLYPIHFLFASR